MKNLIKNAIIKLKFLSLKIMKIFAHFKTIKDDPGKFILWFISSIILALSAIWLPTLLGLLIGQDFFDKTMENNPIVIFSIVFLSNSILTAINYKGAGTNKFAVSIRGITIVLTILYLILLSSIIPLKIVNNISLEYSVQSGLLIITVMFGVYIYGFREATWENSVNEYKEEQENTVTDIVGQAHAANNDGGIEL